MNDIKPLKVNDVLSGKERGGILALSALNKLDNHWSIYKHTQLGRLYISFRWQSSKRLMGRFGGGWQWAVGFEASRRSIIFNCLVFSVGFSIRQRKSA